MKILLTGTAGFIGFHLAEELLKRNFEVLGVDNINDYYEPKLKLDRLQILKNYNNFKFEKIDITNKESLSKAFKSYNPEKVVNLAAQPGVRYSLINPYAYVSSNLDGFINIIELCRHNKVEGLIYASSSSVYGNNKSIPFKISDNINKPKSLYGATKIANELIAYTYSHLHNLNTTGLRFFTVYGPWYRPDMAMYRFTKKIIENKSIDVYNNGKMKRDFTFIDDIVNGTISSIEKNYFCEVFNLGNEKSERLMDMVNLIEKEIGKKAKINYKSLQPGDMVETFADIDLSKEKLDYSPKINIKDGIPLLVNWYRDYYNV